MRVLICTVGDRPAFPVAKSGNGVHSENQRRLAAMEALLDAAKDEAVDLAVLPGGYFAANGNIDNTPLLPQIWEAIKRRAIPVCFGIDVAEKKGAKKGKRHGYACAWTKQERCAPVPLDLWRQRSVTSTDQISQAAADQMRYLRIGGQKVAVLVCGEVFNRQIRAATQRQRVQVVVDLVHTGKGFRATRTLEPWSSACPINYALLSCHAKKARAMKRWAVNGNDRSDNQIDILVAGPPLRIEGRVVVLQ